VLQCINCSGKNMGSISISDFLSLTTESFRGVLVNDDIVVLGPFITVVERFGVDMGSLPPVTAPDILTSLKKVPI
jgi:hypothetical protein